MGATDGGLWSGIVPRPDAGVCRLCEECPPLAACLSGALRRRGPGSLPSIDQNLCFGCYSCAMACPWDAIVLPLERVVKRT